jgi:hypothetical protein
MTDYFPQRRGENIEETNIRKNGNNENVYKKDAFVEGKRMYKRKRRVYARDGFFHGNLPYII